MTCIIGYKDQFDNLWFGGDSMGVSETEWLILKEPKIFIKDKMIFGFSSSLRFGQILKYSFNIPVHYDEDDITKYICNDVMIELNKICETTNFKTDKETDEDWTFLLGYKGKLFTVQSNFQIIEDVKNYAVIGCGGDYAKGALYTMEKNKSLTPEQRIFKALDAAAQFSMVKPPFHVLKLDSDKEINSINV